MPNYHFRNLVFEGGGVKGIAYVGAIAALNQRDPLLLPAIERVGGTSAGAINAVLVGLNFSAEETRELLWNLNFNKFMDDTWGIIRDMDRLREEFGWYKGDFFRSWIARLIEQKTGNRETTFADLARLKAEQPQRGFKELYFIGTNLSTRHSEVFSARHTPGVTLADAVRISMSIPLFFAAKRSLRGDVYVDGGVLRNYPIKLFDEVDYLSTPDHGRSTQYYQAPRTYNQETLGFRLDTAAEIATFGNHAEPPHHPVDDFFDYAWALIKTYMEAQQNNHLHSDDWQRTVYIDSQGVGTTQFDLDDATKRALVKSGEAGVKKYFDWYDKAAKARNKPGTS